MLVLHEVAYQHPNKELLFENLNLSILKHDKIALIGNNGIGKSILLKLIAGEIKPSSGNLKTESPPYLVPQVFGQFNELTVAEALGINIKLNALYAILNGEVDDYNFEIIGDDWDIENRCESALAYWNLADTSLSTEMRDLSGGQKTAVFLAGISIHRPAIVLLDEPTNHLDMQMRALLYQYIETTKDTLVVVSHDESLLDLLQPIYEVDRLGLKKYGGDYVFYLAQKALEVEGLYQDLQLKAQTLKAKEVERIALQRQQKLDSRGKKKQDKAGLPTIVKNALKNNAERSTAQIKAIHSSRTDSLSTELEQLRNALPATAEIKIDIKNPSVSKGKVWFSANQLNFSYNDKPMWTHPLHFQLTSGERISIIGNNGSGKTTLLKLILGEFEPTQGTLNRIPINSIYIDQEYSLIHPNLSVYEQAQFFNDGELQEHEIKLRLNRFLFPKSTWDKPCHVLSAGEKMRLLLCSITIGNHTPELIVLDEPTNNLDKQNMEILIEAMASYKGTVLVVSHDIHFLNQIRINRSIILE